MVVMLECTASELALKRHRCVCKHCNVALGDDIRTDTALLVRINTHRNAKRRAGTELHS